MNKSEQKLTLLAIILAVSLMMPPGASACLPAQDVLMWHDLEQQLNISNNTLVNLAERQCERTVTRELLYNELNGTEQDVEDTLDRMDRLLDTHNASAVRTIASQTVQDEMNNWTDWIERECSVRQMLSAIYNQTNSTTDTAGLAKESYVNAELSGMADRISDVEDGLEGIDTNITNMKRIPGGRAPATGGNSWMVWAAIALVLGVLAYQLNIADVKNKLSPGGRHQAHNAVENLKSRVRASRGQEAPGRPEEYRYPVETEKDIRKTKHDRAKELQSAIDRKKKEIAERKAEEERQEKLRRISEAEDDDEIRRLEEELVHGDDSDKADKNPKGKAGKGKGR